MNVKRCVDCGENKDRSAFRGNRSRCLECTRLQGREQYRLNAAEQRKRKLAAYHAMGPEKWARHQELRKQYFLANPERRASKEYFQEYYQGLTEEQKAAKVAKLNKWSKDRPHLHAARQKCREAAKQKAVPKWANGSAIQEIYLEAKQTTELTGVDHQVDHIVPLKSRYVCGLHCEANLRVISAIENRQKSNRFWPDMA